MSLASSKLGQLRLAGAVRTRVIDIEPAEPVNTVGYCETCLNPNCPTPERRMSLGGNCFLWQNGEVPSIACQPAGMSEPVDLAPELMGRKMELAQATAILPADQAARVDRIKQYHSGCMRAFGDQMGYAFLAGVELNALKEQTPHGKFLALLDTHIPEITHRTANRYQKFAEALQTHSKLLADKPAIGKKDTVSYLEAVNPETSLQYAAGALRVDGHWNPDAVEKVLAAVHEVADGKTLTEMYRDLGVIRQPQKPQHHPRKNDPAAEINKPEDLGMAGDLLIDILFVLPPEETELDEAPTELLRKLHSAGQALTLRIEAIFRARKIKVQTPD